MGAVIGNLHGEETSTLAGATGAAMRRTLITGASGFVGSALCATLRKIEADFAPVYRRMPTEAAYVAAHPQVAGNSAAPLIVPDITPATDWLPLLQDVDVVVHLAARVHLLQDKSADPLAQYRFANTASTLHLARQCAQAGVKRLIYLSSIKVNGESTHGAPFRAADTPHPQDPYGISKWEAEQGLWQIAQQTGLEIVVIRPPLVYGPRVKANFLQLMRWVKYGIPLPLAGINNRRSMVFVGNLVDLILQCTTHVSAAGKTFLVSDDSDISTAALIRSIASAMQRRAPLFSLPQGILTAGAHLLGRRSMADRLFGSLQVDIQPTKDTLDWTPPFSFAAGILETVDFFCNYSDLRLDEHHEKNL
jgi:UDP-glucose 4-epimerase